MRSLSHSLYGLTYFAFILMHVLIWTSQAQEFTPVLGGASAFLVICMSSLMLMVTVLCGSFVREIFEQTPPLLRGREFFRRLLRPWLIIISMDGLKNSFMGSYPWFTTWGLFHTIAFSLLLILLLHTVDKRLPWILGIVWYGLKPQIFQFFYDDTLITRPLPAGFSSLNVILVSYTAVLLGLFAWCFRPEYRRLNTLLRVVLGTLVLILFFVAIGFRPSEQWHHYLGQNYLLRAFIGDNFGTSPYAVINWFLPVLIGFYFKDFWNWALPSMTLVTSVLLLVSCGVLTWVSSLAQGARLDEYLKVSLQDRYNTIAPVQFLLFFLCYRLAHRFSLTHRFFHKVVYAYIVNYFFWVIVGSRFVFFLGQFFSGVTYFFISLLFVLGVSVCIAELTYLVLSKRIKLSFSRRKN
jgi:hypothetical protein